MVRNAVSRAARFERRSVRHEQNDRGAPHHGVRNHRESNEFDQRENRGGAHYRSRTVYRKPGHRFVDGRRESHRVDRPRRGAGAPGSNFRERSIWRIFTVQVGAFKEKGNAERLRARLDELYPPSTIQQVAIEDGTFYRVRAGKVSGEQAAQKFADDLHAKEGFHTMVIRLDEAASGVEE